MELLHPSADIPYVGTQKDILGLNFSKTLQMGMTWDAFTLELACHTIFLSVELRTRLFPLTTHVLYVTIYIATRVHQRTRASFEQLACHTRVAYINSRVHLNLALKNIKRD